MPGRQRLRFGGRGSGRTNWPDPSGLGSAMPVWLPQVSGEVSDFLAHRSEQAWAGPTAFGLACHIRPALAGCLLSFDLGIEFGEAGIAIFDCNVATANPIRRARHAILL